MQPFANLNKRVKNLQLTHKFDPTPAKIKARTQSVLEEELRKPEDKKDISLIDTLKGILREWRR
jgi:hypothetical protein